MRSLVFRADTWPDYEGLRERDKKTHKVLAKQIKEMLRGDPTIGSGKPEKLKYGLSNLWSRRLSQRDRVVYDFDDDHVYLFAIGSHYSQFKER